MRRKMLIALTAGTLLGFWGCDSTIGMLWWAMDIINQGIQNAGAFGLI